MPSIASPKFFDDGERIGDTLSVIRKLSIVKPLYRFLVRLIRKPSKIGFMERTNYV
jgi:hypothetical protein